MLSQGNVPFCRTIDVYKIIQSLLTSFAAYKDIKIVFDGQPSTDGKTVYLGAPAADSQIALEAYLAHGTHEIHHVLHTDFSLVRTLGALHPLVNALEDVRIDAIGYRRLPGTFYWRETYLEKLSRQGILPRVKKGLSPGLILCLTFYWVMSEATLDYSFVRDYAQEARSVFIELYGEKLFKQLYQLAEKAVRSKNTNTLIHYCRLIAQQFTDSFKTLKERHDNETQNDGRRARKNEGLCSSETRQDFRCLRGRAEGNGGSSKSGSEKSDRSVVEKTQQEKIKTDKSGSGKTSAAKVINGKANSEKAKRGRGGAGIDEAEVVRELEQEFAKLYGKEDPDQFDLHQLIRNQVAAMRQVKAPAPTFGVSGQKGAVSEAEDCLGIWPIVRSELSNKKDKTFHKELQEIQGSRLLRLRRLLSSQSMENFGLARSGCNLSDKALSRVMVGDTRVFSCDFEAQRISAAFSILIDRSGSMDNRIMRAASLCGYMLCDLIAAVGGCVSSVSAFPGVERHTLLEVKRFDEKPGQVIHRFSALRSFGHTPILQSLNTAAAQLSVRREKRKIIFLITDGLLGEEDRLRKCADRLKWDGIEVVCLSIGYEASPVFDHQRNITYSREMPEAVYALFETKAKSLMNKIF